MRRQSVLLLVIAMTSALQIGLPFGGKAAEGAPSTVIDAAPGTEHDRIVASAGQVERHGKDLLVFLPLPWSNGNERGYVFRNWSFPGNSSTDPDGSSFVYYGKIGSSYLVLERFTHDSPTLYLIESNGVERQYPVGDQELYATDSGLHLVTLRPSTLQGGPLLTVGRMQHLAEASDDQYAKEFQCDAPITGGEAGALGFSARPLSITDSEIAFEVTTERQTSSSNLEKKTLGTIRIHADGSAWAVQEPKALWDGVTCQSY